MYVVINITKTLNQSPWVVLKWMNLWTNCEETFLYEFSLVSCEHIYIHLLFYEPKRKKKRYKNITIKCITILCFHSRGQHLCKLIGTKENVYIRKEFNSHRTGLEHKHGHRFIGLGHKYGRHDIMWKHTIHTCIGHPN